MRSNAEKLLNVNWFIVRDIKEKEKISFIEIIQLIQLFLFSGAGGNVVSDRGNQKHVQFNVKFINTLCVHFSSRHKWRLWAFDFWLISIIHEKYVKKPVFDTSTSLSFSHLVPDLHWNWWQKCLLPFNWLPINYNHFDLPLNQLDCKLESIYCALLVTHISAVAQERRVSLYFFFSFPQISWKWTRYLRDI